MRTDAKWLVPRLADGACVVVLAVAFVLAAAGKIISPDPFVRVIQSHGLIPDAMIIPLALYLPWLELCVGVAVLLPRWRHVSAMVAGILVAGFTVVLLRQWSLGDSGDCGCMGVVALSVPWAVARNVVLLVAVAWLLHRAGMRNAVTDIAPNASE